MKKSLISLIFLGAALISMAFAEESSALEEFQKEQANKAIVIEALNHLFNERDVSVLDDYWSDDYIQHNPTLPNGTEALAGFVSSANENLSAEFGTVVADGDFVFAYMRYTFPDGTIMIGADIFRLEGGLLVEHWDVLQPEVPSSETASGNAMFPITTELSINPEEVSEQDAAVMAALEDANKRIFAAGFGGLFGKGDLSVVETFWSEDYTQHNPTLPNGRDALVAVASSFNGESTAEFGVLAAEGDLVFGHMRYNLPGIGTVVVVDVLRFENGLMTQHWDVIQPEVPASETVSGNSMFSGD